MRLRRFALVVGLVLLLVSGCLGCAEKPANKEIFKREYRVVIPSSWSLVEGSDANLSIWESPSGNESLSVTIIGHWETLSDYEQQMDALEGLIELEEESADECSEPAFVEGDGICLATCDTTGWAGIPDSHAITVIITGPDYAVAFVYLAEGFSEAQAREAGREILKTARIVI